MNRPGIHRSAPRELFLSALGTPEESAAARPDGGSQLPVRSATSRSTTSGRALPTPTHGTTRTSARSPMTSPTRTVSTATRRAPCSRPGRQRASRSARRLRGSTASPATAPRRRHGGHHHQRARPPPTTRREPQRVSPCAGCHDQHKTVQQWKYTPHAEHREGCMECHMPHRDGLPRAGGSTQVVTTSTWFARRRAERRTGRGRDRQSDPREHQRPRLSDR